MCLAIRWMDTCVIAKLTYWHVHTYVCMVMNPLLLLFCTYVHKAMDVYAYVCMCAWTFLYLSNRLTWQ